MKNKIYEETAHLSAEENKELHSAMLQNLRKINEYFDAPHAAKQNLMPEIKVADRKSVV